MKNIRLEFEAIGTHWQIDYVGQATNANQVSLAIASCIDRFDQTYSRFIPHSWLNRTANRAGKHSAPKDFDQMFRLYQAMNKITNGAVNPLIGDALERAGYDANYSLKPKSLRQIPKLDDAISYNGNTLHVKYNISLDFGAAGKGFLVDQLAEVLRQHDISEYTVDAGGDMIHHSPAPNAKITEVGLEDPDDPKKVIGIAKLGNSSLCASAGNRRQWAGFHHIINPQTLKPEDSIKAVWVIAHTTMLADGMATCLFFTQPEVLQKEFDFDYLILDQDRTARKSDSFPARLFD